MSYTLQEILDAMASRQQAVQLVKHYDELTDKERAKLDWTCASAEVKYDGVYALVVHTSDMGWCLLSRTGKRLYCQDDVLHCILGDTGILQPRAQGMVWVVELCNGRISLETLSGLLNPNRVTPWQDTEVVTMCHTMPMVHDCMTCAELIRGCSPRPQMQRKSDVYSVVARKYIIHDFPVTSEQEWLSFADKAVNRGEEGAVLKQGNAPWVAGPKSHVTTKVVRGVHLDLKCTGWALGKGKRSSQIAKLHFNYQGKPFSADLGKGWTDARRDALTDRALADNDTVTGKIFHVKGLCISSKGVIRLPKVQEERVDKEKPDV